MTVYAISHIDEPRNCNTIRNSRVSEINGVGKLDDIRVNGKNGLLRVYNGYVVKNTLTNEVEFN